MEEQFVPYELAVKLKELGFDEPCLTRVNEIGAVYIKGTRRLPNGAMCTDEVNTPLWQQAFDWFREEHGFTFIIDDYNISGDIGFDYQIRNINKFDIGLRNKVIWNAFNFKTYKEARQACLEKLIELTLNK